MATKDHETYRVEFTVERKGRATRRVIEGTNLEKLMARVEKLDGFQVNVLSEIKGGGRSPCDGIGCEATGIFMHEMVVVSGNPESLLLCARCLELASPGTLASEEQAEREEMAERAAGRAVAS